jgi:hypothetical protein
MKKSLLTTLILPALVSSCLTLPTSDEAQIRYSTEPSNWPANEVCLNRPVQEGIAKEVLLAKKLTVVIAGGENPISDKKWESFTPRFPNVKNSDRHTLFTQSCFIRSPKAAADCIGDSCRQVEYLNHYSWIALSKISAADCLPSGKKCDPSKVKAGQLAFVVTEKCHRLVFEDRAIFLYGPGGEKAIMHATADGKPTTAVDLPKGWRLREESLLGPMVLYPFGGDNKCFYNVIRDSRMQSYHQIKYAGDFYP